MNSEYDKIKNPSHYCADREYEPRKVIEDWGLNFYLGNVVKYISRAGRKGSALEDLEKAQQYLMWEIERVYSEGMTEAYEEFENAKIEISEYEAHKIEAAKRAELKQRSGNLV